MFNHVEKELPELEKQEREQCFNMKILKTHKSAFVRQISEVTLIMRARNNKNITTLHRKQEYDRCVIPEITIEDRRTQGKCNTPEDEIEK